jgi:hypothetical protein
MASSTSYFLIMQFSLASYDSISLMFKYFLQHRVLNQPAYKFP